jgi:penicillin G amidase
MKILKKASLIFLLLVVVVLVVAIVFTQRLAKSGLPNYGQGAPLEGLLDEVTVIRDSLGIPHIYAQNEADMYKVTGYLMAQERIWQMDLLRRVTQGRLSEIFGEEYVKTDLLLRSLRFSEKSEKIMRKSSPEVTAALAAFVTGVNAYLKENSDNLPFEFSVLGYKPEPWEAVHSLNLIGYMAWDLKAGWGELVLEDIASVVDSVRFAELLPDPAKSGPYVFNNAGKALLASNSLQELSKLEALGLDIFAGSNNWAVSGKKSATGKPLLANDMHLGFGIPGIWMQLHQQVKGSLNVSGLALPGQPMIIVGHNDSIAWGMTNTYVDNLDFYEEKTHPNDTNKYLLNGEWRDFEVREEIIKDKKGNEHRLHYRLNHRGPVVSNQVGYPDRVLTIRWVGDEESDEMRTIYLLNRADNWEEFREAFRSFRSISQNVAYADTRGNIGLYCCAGVPVRKRDGLYSILPGTSDEYDWQGMIPFDELPYEYNPERGYVSSANNRTAPPEYPHHIGTWYSLPYRIERIREMLGSKDVLSKEDFQAMQNDFISVYSRLFLEYTLPVLEKSGTMNETEREVFERLRNWNYELGSASVEATVSEYWSGFMIEALFRDELGEALFERLMAKTSLALNAFDQFLRKGNTAWADDIETEEAEAAEDIVLRSYRKTIGYLQENLGKEMDTWKWGMVHALTLKHPVGEVEALNKIFNLNRGPLSVGGSSHTVSPYRYLFLEPGKIIHGASHRNIYDLADWDQSVSVIPTGNSGVPASEFYCDQTGMFVEGEYHADPFSDSSVQSAAYHVLRFTPANSAESVEK